MMPMLQAMSWNEARSEIPNCVCTWKIVLIATPPE
ncbi:MAG: hypothetical protein RLZZ221_2097 [Verrucomicrobiota bacterium]